MLSYHTMAYSMENSEGVPKIMTPQLLSEITNDFSEEIGSGTYGVVYKGVLNGKDIAVKKLRQMQQVDIREQFKKESENLWRLRHQNIVKLLGYCYEIQHKIVDCKGRFVLAEIPFGALCFEYMHKGSLQNYLSDESSGLNWPTRYKIIKGTCEGLKYLQEGLETPIYHLDLKPNNILLDKNMVPKLADFGLSKFVHNDQTEATQSTIGTSGYLPPEYIAENLVSKKLDIFSLGVVMIRLMTGYEGYYKQADMSPKEFIDLVHNKWRIRLQKTEVCTSVDEQCLQVKRCIEIALGCINADRKQRPEIGAIIHWLNETENTTEILAMALPQGIRNEKVLSHIDMPFKDGSIKVDSEETSNVYGRFMEHHQSGPVITQSEATEDNLIFYMHQTISGANHNQVNIADPELPLLFGCTNVHDYPVYDGLGPNATIVARARGLHTMTSMNFDDWLHWSSIVFSDIRFRGSSIMAFGNQGKIQGEWAIVGGTGLFTFAKGTITIYRIQGDESSNIKEICIHLFCCPPQTPPTMTKMMHFKKVDSITSSNSSKAPMINSQTSYVISTGSEYNFKFYMNQTIGGPNHNQVNILDPKQPAMFGYTNVHDYQIYDSLGPTAKVVARAQGLHTETNMNYADSWFHWSSIVFIDERFQGSSLKAIGNQDTGEWAIIGGTGVFTFAQGTISIDRIQDNGSSNMKEIHIHAFCQKYETTKHFWDRSKMVGTSATSNDCSPVMTIAQSVPVTPQSQATEYNFRLYMYQDIDGENNNQVNIADPKQYMMFGYTNVHDYPIYDRLGLNAKIVARAQGLHTETNMNSDDWFHWSSIIFCDESFQGSSLKAIGNQGKVQGEWVIVGGTGLFTCAQGTISIFRIQDNGSSNIKEIRIIAYCNTPRTTQIGI